MEMGQPKLNNDGTMEQHAPETNNTCRIVTLTVFKLVLSLGLLIILMYSVYLCYMFGPPPINLVLFLYVTIFLDVVDILVVLITVISVCAEYNKIIKLYYKYSTYIVGSMTISCFLGYHLFLGGFSLMFIIFSVTLLFMMIQMFLNYKMKKEVLMLGNNEESPL